MPEASADLIAFVPLCDLAGIDTTELVARRTSQVKDEETIHVRPAFSLDVDVSADPIGFSLILRVEIENTWGEISAAVIANYTVEGRSAAQLEEKLLVEFADNVGVMTLLPFLRQAIADLTQRVFKAPLIMPTFSRGDLAFSGKPREPITL